MIGALRHRLRLIVVVAGGIAACAGGLRAQNSASLASITVPESRLPADCRLRPIAQAPVVVPKIGDHRVSVVRPSTSEPYPSNPWSGTDSRLLVETRKRIDPSPSAGVVDAPRTAAEAQAIDADWIEHLVAAYHALYDSADGTPVEISAVKFDDPSRALTSRSVTSLLHQSPARDDRIVRGEVVIRLAGNAATSCFKAIDAYVRALK